MTCELYLNKTVIKDKIEEKAAHNILRDLRVGGLAAKIISVAKKMTHMVWQSLSAGTLFIRQRMESVSKEPYGFPNAIQVFSKERNKATNIVKAYTSVCQIWQPYFFFTKVGIFLLLDKQREFHTLLFEALQNLVKYNFSLVPILWMREFQERKRPRLESRPFGQRPRGLSIYQAA